jgi:hypothetical protein
MTDSSGLERRYRRLLVLYPRAFRREREEEIVAVLMAGATEGQRRPRLDESTNLIGSAIFTRLRQAKLQPDWVFRHPRTSICIYVIPALWWLVLTTLLCSIGYWWGLGLLPFVALHLWLARRVARTIEPHKPPSAA